MRIEAQPSTLVRGVGRRMGKLFLSYSRKDETKARRFVDWLESSGHDVWRDEDDIRGGASFSSEIENALNESSAVLVLWSKSSIQSAWVRDEAGYGRDAGKLIPFSLDGSEPPLGFRQFQSIDLSKWRAGSPPKAQQTEEAIERVTGLAQATNVPEHSKGSRWLNTLQRPQLIGATIAIAAAAAGLLVWQRWTSDQEISIAVVSSPQSSDRAMAAEYANAAAADLGAFLPRRFDRAIVIAPDDAIRLSSDYQMEISTDPHGAAADASLTLSDERGHTTLWSYNWSVTDASAADLRAEVSAAASRAAYCLMEARGGSTRLSQPALGLYLNGCTELGDTKLSNADFVTIFERITKLAPDFAPAWSYLALSRAWVAASLRDSSPAAYAAALKSARDTISTALRLNPSSAMPYDAEYHLIYNDHFRALQVLDRASEVDPEDPRIQMHRSDELLSVGRMADSIEAAQRSVEIDPGPFARSQYILALVYSGRFSKAAAEIAEAQKKWPNDPVIDAAEFELQYRYGDPRAALKLLPKITDSSDSAMAPDRQVIAARLDPTRAKIDATIALLNARVSTDPSARNDVLFVLGSFGRVDDVYRMLNDPGFQPFINKAILFRPDFAAVRADPRFMQVAARLGLVRYWLQTGYWPDYCTNEQLHYDCKVEAGKYSA